ncbi:MAG: hypothetical protein ACRCT7_18540, partial [Shewanella sp.]
MFSIKNIALYTLLFSNVVVAQQLTAEYEILADRWTESIIGIPEQEYDAFQQNMISNIQRDAMKYLHSLNMTDMRHSLWDDLPLDYS